MLLTLAIVAEIAVSLAGLILLAFVLQRLRRERHLKDLAIVLSCFLLFQAALLRLTLSQNLYVRLQALQIAGVLLLVLFGACAWGAKALLAEKSSRRKWMLAVSAALLGFGFIHLKSGLFKLLLERDHALAIILTLGGKYLLAAAVFGSFLLLGKFEMVHAAFAWRYGKRSTSLAATLLLLVLAMITFCSVSLIYGRLSVRFLVGGELICAFFFVTHISALRYGSGARLAPPATTARATQFLSTAALIYGGIYLIIFGLLVKAVTVLGGDWNQFVSFFAALSAIVLALALITGKSVRRRWTRFVERNLLVGSYDFRRELQHLTEAVSVATGRDQLVQVVCRTLTEVFSSVSCAALIEDEGSRSFQIFGINENSGSESNSAEFALSEMQMAWLERMSQSFNVTSLMALNGENNAGEKLQRFLSNGGYELGETLFAGQRLLGVIFLGPKRDAGRYSGEDRQLLDLLGNAISLSLHSSNLQQRMLASKQMESIYRLASFMTHDLRNAVSSLTLLAQNARAHLEKKEFRADFITALSRISEEMQTLVRKLSAVKTGGELQHYAECDPAEVIYETLAELPMPMNVVLDVEVVPLPRAVWDKGQIRVVLRNLLLNALEAMPEGGKLAVRGTQDHTQIKIAVSDTGAGMSRDFIRHRLFKPNQTTKAKGLGIGLYQSREVVSAHGGSIQVKSQIGEGTTFEIILPCLHEKAALQEAHDDAAGALPFAN